MVFEKSLLFEKLNESEDFKNYVELINSVCEKFGGYLEAINKLFGDYTDHGIKHSESVLDALEKLVEDNEELRKLYEMIKARMGDLNGISQ